MCVAYVIGLISLGKPMLVIDGEGRDEIWISTFLERVYIKWIDSIKLDMLSVNTLPWN